MQAGKINIAIDGYSSCGKSTLAQDLAKRLGYTYIDSGAMYRAVTLYALRQKLDIHNYQAVAQVLPDIHIHFSRKGDRNETFLNGENVETQIRDMEVAQWVSPIAVIPAVRRAMVQQQQALAKERGVVMDGRDIGTVVLPESEVKLFLTAHLETRLERRYLELIAKGKPVDRLSIKKNLLTRDYIDGTRSDSPLMKAPGAVTIDNTHLNPEEQLLMVLALVHYRQQKLSQ